MSVKEKADLYIEARREYERAHAESQQAHAQMRSTEYDLIDAMLEDCTQSIGLEIDGSHKVKIALTKRTSCSVTKGNQAVIRQWLTEYIGSDEDFLEEAVNKAALLEWIKSNLAADNDFNESIIPPELKFSSRPGLQVQGLNIMEKKR